MPPQAEEVLDLQEAGEDSIVPRFQGMPWELDAEVFVDDIRMEVNVLPYKPPEDGPPPGGNWVYDASAEVGLKGWDLRQGRALDAGPVVMLDDTVSDQGRRSYFLKPALPGARSTWPDRHWDEEYAEWSNKDPWGRPPVFEGEVVKACCWIKTGTTSAEWGGGRIGLSFYSSSGDPVRGVESVFVPWGSEWSYVKVEVKAEIGENFVIPYIQALPDDEPAMVWFDSIRMEIS